MKLRIALVVAAFLTLAVALTEDDILTWRLFVLLLLVMGAAYLWARLGIRGITGEVGPLPDHCQVGEWFDEEITVANRGWLPRFPIRFEQTANLPGYADLTLTSLAAHSSRRWHHRVHCRRRGQYHLGALTATVADPFGLFSHRRRLAQPQRVLIYPATLELPFFRRWAGSSAGYGSRRWMVTNLSPEASNVREYTTGDSLNHIHWRSTAHTGELMVKVFDPDRSEGATRNVWLVADMQRGVQAGEGEESTEEYGITIAASVIKKYLDNGNPVGLMAEGDQPYLAIPQRGEAQLRQVLATLSLMRASGTVPVDRLLAEEMGRFGNGAVVIVVTPSAQEPVVTALRRLAERGHVVIAVLLDAASFGGGTGTTPLAHRLTASGIPAYVVRQGAELATALDDRTLAHR